MESTLSRRQLLALGTVSFLAPALRFYPSESVALAGRAAWTAALLALPLMLGYCYFLIRLLALRREGEGLAELTRRLGGGLGPVLLGLAALWTLLYAAFVLRSGADRLVGTVYPKASPGVFIEVMGLLSLLAALAGPRSLGRMARIVQPFLLGVLLLLLFVALARADMDKLLSMCLIHDLGEAFTGDIPTFLKTDGQRAVEDGAVDAMVDALPPALGARWRELYREMEQQCTPEGRLYKGLDKIEALIQHNFSDISTWIPLEYQLNLHYADKECAPFPALTALRELVR